MKFRLSIAVALFALLPCAAAQAAAPGSLLLNQANTVSGGVYLEKGKADPALGRLQGNGQNWINFVVAGNDPSKHTLDLRGWEMDWSFHKSDNTSFGSGVMKFSQDAVWSAVPQGTMITVNEFQKAWYLINTPAYPGNPDGDTYTDPISGDPGTGMQRDGGINGFNQQTGSPFNPAIDTMRDFSTNAIWNPAATGGPDWNMNVWAGQGLNSSTGVGQLFSFSGSVTKNADNSGEGGVSSQVGHDSAGGLFVANNDNWQFTLKDNLGNVIQGPIGEAVAGWGLTNGQPNGAGGISAGEILKLQSFAPSDHATAANYQGVTISNYADGTTSSYGAPNQWTVNNALVTQDLSPLRNWFSGILQGDSDLNGTVNFADFQALQNNFGQSGKGWQQGDFNGDSTVNFADFQLLQNKFGQTGGGGGSLPAGLSAVPEPSTVALLGVGLLALVGFRRRLNHR